MLFRTTQKLYYWKNLGVPSPSPMQQIKFAYEFFTQKRANHHIKKEEYKMFEGERFYGTFDGNSPVLVIRDDFHLLRSVMIKDFDHFAKAQGGLFSGLDAANRVEEIEMKGITICEVDEWKAVR